MAAAPGCGADRRPGGRGAAVAFADWVGVAGQVPATVPMWLSRRRWIATVCRWAATEEGVAVLKAHHVSYTLFCAVVRVIARHAQGRTGRNVAVTNERIAAEAAALIGKCSERSVTTVRRGILAPAGWAMEVARGTGQHAGRYNRPSLWHLLSRAVCDLSSTSDFDLKSSVEKSSPSAARRRRTATHTTSGTTTGTQTATTNPEPQPRPAATAPRDRHLLVLAGHLGGRCMGFAAVHPGRIAAVLAASHLDLGAWSARELLAALDTQTRQRGFTWPDRLAHPAGFLAHRIASLPVRPAAIAPTPIPPRYVADDEPRGPVASAEVRAAARAAARQAVINARRAAAAA
jgi:hypothetical protein